MTKEQKDFLLRLLFTFIEGVIAYIIINLGEFDLSNKQILKAFITGAIASGVSAVINMLRIKYNIIKEENEEEAEDE